ncbi:uncharacterized protein LOC113773426 [Coffea eugenioides]|uniref:uncharacterized protein LOC113773426 n=1 Tax=Coffea eugenioides TaxID=49369 RepID=UPI000F6071F6|nr:uncharacterized protein LOC113773426 [Coffea eugenioides]
MASFGRFCLFAWLLWGNLGVQGDDSAIVGVCKKIGIYYDMCYACLKSNPREPDFAAKSMICTTNAYVILRKSTFDFLLNSTGRFREVAKLCVDQFDITLGYCKAAFKAWKLKRKLATLAFLNSGYDYYFKCVDLLSIRVPIEYVVQLNTAKAFNEVSIEIVSLP